jgi:hypothetical protein
MVDREQRELGEEIEDFRKRVTELESARSLSTPERLRLLEATLFELRHAADRLWPRFRALAAETRPVAGTGRQEERLLRAVFQRHPLPMALLDRETVVRRLNPSAARLVAAGPGYTTGRPLTGFLAFADRAAFRTHVAAVARDEGDRSLVVRLLPGAEESQVTLVALRPPGEPRRSVLAVLQAAGQRAADGAGPAGLTGLAKPARPVHPVETTRVAGVARVNDTGGTARPSDLTDAARGAELLDLLNQVAAALLTARGDGPETRLRATGDALVRHCADWVIADLVEPDGEMRRVAVCAAPTSTGAVPPADAADRTGAAAPADGVGPANAVGGAGWGTEGVELTAQDPSGCPVVVAAATGGVVAVQVRPDDVECLGRDRTGTAMVARLGVTSLVCLPVCAAPGAAAVPAVLTLLRTSRGARPGFCMAEAGVLDRAARLTALALTPDAQEPPSPPRTAYRPPPPGG